MFTSAPQFPTVVNLKNVMECGDELGGQQLLAAIVPALDNDGPQRPSRPPTMWRLSLDACRLFCIPVFGSSALKLLVVGDWQKIELDAPFPKHSMRLGLRVHDLVIDIGLCGNGGGFGVLLRRGWWRRWGGGGHECWRCDRSTLLSGHTQEGLVGGHAAVGGGGLGAEPQVDAAVHLQVDMHVRLARDAPVLLRVVAPRSAL